MTSHLTHVRGQQHIADLQRQAANRLATTPKVQPAEPRRGSAHWPWIVQVTGVHSARPAANNE